MKTKVYVLTEDVKERGPEGIYQTFVAGVYKSKEDVMKAAMFLAGWADWTEHEVK